MHSLPKQEFQAARNALLNAATAVDAMCTEDAVHHLRSLLTICDLLLELLGDVKGHTPTMEELSEAS